MSKGGRSGGVRELEKRLREEPDNLGLRVQLAGALRESGRREDAFELYRSVALAYRDQGRIQQAIAVCRSVLEVDPDEQRFRNLMVELLAHDPSRTPSGDTMPRLDRETTITPLLPPPPGPPEPRRRSSQEVTPLPRPVPYHVHDPTTASLPKLNDLDLAMPSSDGTVTQLKDDPATRPEVSGLASAALRISATLIRAPRMPADLHDMAAELDTRQVPRIPLAQLEKIQGGPPTGPNELLEVDEDAQTPPPRDTPFDGVVMRDSDVEEETEPRAVPMGMRPRTRPPVPVPKVSTGMPTPPSSPLVSAFFAPIPADRRGAVLVRFARRSVPASSTVIRQGEVHHPLVLVARGRLELRFERVDGQMVSLGTVGVGEYIGEMSLLAHGPAGCHVIAATDVDLLALAPRDFYEIAGAYPALWAELKEVAERRSREHDQKLRH